MDEGLTWFSPPHLPSSPGLWVRPELYPTASFFSCQLVVSGREAESRLALAEERRGTGGGPAIGRGWRREKGAVGPSDE